MSQYGIEIKLWSLDVILFQWYSNVYVITYNSCLLIRKSFTPLRRLEPRSRSLLCWKASRVTRRKVIHFIVITSQYLKFWTIVLRFFILIVIFLSHKTWSACSILMLCCIETVLWYNLKYLVEVGTVLLPWTLHLEGASSLI